MSTQATKLSSFEIQVETLQSEIDEKAKTIEELEYNLDDMMLMRAALRAQLDDLKLTISKTSSSGSKDIVNEGESCLDLLHSEYESRLTEMQEQYEAQLSYLRTLLEGTDYEAQAAGCSSPSQDSEYSIELSCLRPYLQGQSSPIVDFMAELRSQSVQESHTGLAEDSEVCASSLSCYFLTRSTSGVKRKEEVQSYSSTNGKCNISLSSLRARLRTKSISKAKAKCRSNSSISHLVLNSASRSELKLLQSSLGNSELQISSSKYQTQQLASQPAQKPTTEISCQVQLPNMDIQSPEDAIGVRWNSPPPITTGAKPRPPRRSSTKPTKLPCSDYFGMQTHPGSLTATTTPTTTTTISSTVPSTQPSDPNTTTALDKVTGLRLLRQVWNKVLLSLRRRGHRRSRGRGWTRGLGSSPGWKRDYGQLTPPARPSRRR